MKTLLWILVVGGIGIAIGLAGMQLKAPLWATMTVALLVGLYLGNTRT